MTTSSSRSVLSTVDLKRFPIRGMEERKGTPLAVLVSRWVINPPKRMVARSGTVTVVVNSWVAISGTVTPPPMFVD